MYLFRRGRLFILMRVILALCLGRQFNGSVEFVDLLVRFASDDAEPCVLANIQVLGER